MGYDLMKTFPGPENIRRKRFANGVTVLVKENPFSQAAAYQAYLPVGNYLNSEGKNGLCNYVAACLTSGTAFRSFSQIHEMLETSGASLHFNGNTSNIQGGGSCLSEDLPMTLELMKETLDQPVFPDEYLEIMRQKVLASYQIGLQDPEYRADERFDALLYHETPYGRSEYGSVEIINSITRQDLIDFHKDYIGPQGFILTVTGGISADETMAECERIFGSWNKPQLTVDRAAYFPDVRMPEQSISEHIEIPEKSEMSLVIGTMGPKRSDPDYTAATLGNSILGEFGMMGRIGRVVREDNGLAYNVSASYDGALYGGSWSVDAGVNPVNVEKTAELLMTELRRFTSEEVTEEELEDVKSYAIGSLPFAIESNSGVASMMMRMEANGLGLDYALRMPDRIRAVTTADILETARKWLDTDRMIRVTAGTAAV